VGRDPGLGGRCGRKGINLPGGGRGNGVTPEKCGLKLGLFQKGKREEHEV